MNDNNSRFTAPPVKNWKILLVQSFTARMPLLMAIGAFRLRKRRWSSPQQCYLHCLHTWDERRLQKMNTLMQYSIRSCWRRVCEVDSKEQESCRLVLYYTAEVLYLYPVYVAADCIDWVNFKWRHRQSGYVNQSWTVTAESQPCTEVVSICCTTGGATVCAEQESTTAAEKDARFLYIFCGVFSVAFYSTDSSRTVWCTASAKHVKAVIQGLQVWRHLRIWKNEFCKVC